MQAMAPSDGNRISVEYRHFEDEAVELSPKPKV
jgi:hypothetical protein